MAHRLALLVGNNEYTDVNLSKLISPPHDILQLGELLRAPEIGGFDQVEILDNQPFAIVRRTIATFFTRKNRDDLLLLYFSGHGVLDDNGQLYLAVRDTERELLSATAIEASFITSIMDRSISRRQVLVLDCCHSGAFGRSKGMLGASVGTATTFEGKGYGRIVLTASDATQYAWDGDDLLGNAQTSVFTRYIVQGLRTGEADADADGLITLDELYDFVYENVLTETPNQTPAKWSYKQQGTIVIAQNPTPVVQPAALPEELQRAIESPFAGIRQGAVHDLQRLLQGSDRSLALSAQFALEHLVDDDSRTVSAAAQAALASIESPPAAAVGSSPDSELEPPEIAGHAISQETSTPVEQIREFPAATPQVKEADKPEPARAAVSAPIKPATAETASEAAAPAALPSSRPSPAAVDSAPYLLVAAGVGLGEITSLLLALIVNNYFGYFFGLAVAGWVTGYLLLRRSVRFRWVGSAILAVSWSVPFYLSLYAETTFFILAAVLLSNFITALVIILRPHLLQDEAADRRSLLDLRAVGIALAAGLAGTVGGHYLGAIPFSYPWETFVGAVTDSYPPADVVSSVNPSGYFSIAIASIVGVVILCLVLYLIERYIPAQAAPIPDSIEASIISSPRSTPETTTQVAEKQPQPAVRTQIAIYPFVIIAAGWSLGWVAGLVLAQLLDEFIGLFLGWVLAGLVTGLIIPHKSSRIRWITGVILAVTWSMPFYIAMFTEALVYALSVVFVACLITGLVILFRQRPEVEIG